MANLLDHDNPATRARLRAELSTDLWTPRYNLTLPEQRDLAYKRLKRVFGMGIVSILDFEVSRMRVRRAPVVPQLLTTHAPAPTSGSAQPTQHIRGA